MAHWMTAAMIGIDWAAKGWRELPDRQDNILKFEEVLDTFVTVF
jgi:hypothetical protein